MRLLFLPAIAFLLAEVAACAHPASAPHSVVSEQSPELTLAIDAAFTPLPPLRFPIENLTDAERRIFVDAGADGVLRRMIVIQFEKVQPGSDFRFVFPSTPPRRFGAQVYRAGAFAYDDEAAAGREPLREAGQTRRLLEARGLRPPRMWKVARLARVSDPGGLSEVILFYMENGDAGLPSHLTVDDDLDLTPAESEAMFRRLEAAIRPVRG